MAPKAAVTVTGAAQVRAIDERLILPHEGFNRRVGT